MKLVNSGCFSLVGTKKQSFLKHFEQGWFKGITELQNRLFY